MLKHFLRIALCSILGATILAADKPNVIWIVGEDLGPEIGAYGDKYARTPNIDRLASQGVRFTRAFTHAPVCAPSRSGLLTGRYPTAIGTHHMRSKLLAPPRPFTSYLRDAGYHVAWPGKTDFNFDVPAGSFDSTKPWLQTPPREPFFAFINLGETHESQIRATPQKLAENLKNLKPGDKHDFANAPIPPYHPDTAETRRDLATYYDLVTAVDYRVGEILRRLDDHGLSSNTVVCFFGDHGRGLPRSKRWVYDSGIHVPLIVRWPGQIEAGTVEERLISFIDFAPTTLQLAGVAIPKEMDGIPFFGPGSEPRDYIFAARDRMDETYDRIRAVRDERFKYIRNFHPELPYAQLIEYGEEMPTLKAWRRGNREGTLNEPQKLFFAATKPKEELYDTMSDPQEINNLASDSKHAEKLRELRGALDEWTKKHGDLGSVPERELIKRGLVADKLSEYDVRLERRAAAGKQ